MTIAAPTVILDRDGVINFDSDDYIKSPVEWKAIPGSIKAISSLTKNGYQVAIATNQSGLERGLFNLETLNAIHKKLESEVNAAGGIIQLITFCPHHPNTHCKCRKPKTGLLENIHAQLGLCPDRSWMVGDTDKDILVGQRMGIRSALVLTGKGRRMISDGTVSRETTPVFDDLAMFVAWLVAN